MSTKPSILTNNAHQTTYTYLKPKKTTKTLTKQRPAAATNPAVQPAPSTHFLELFSNC